MLKISNNKSTNKHHLKDAYTIVHPVWKTWQIFQTLKFHRMIKKINTFPSVHSVTMDEIAWKIDCIDLFDHLVALEVLVYLPSFPYWQSPPPCNC